MILEITPAVIFGGIGASAAAGSLIAGLVLFIADSRYFKQTDGARLEIAITQLAESIKGFTDTKNGLERVHARIDGFASKLDQLIGSCKGSSC